MAAIDKIYGTQGEFDIFYKWVELNQPAFLKHFYPRDGYADGMGRPITSFPIAVDIWMLNNCPLDWVTARILEQYNGEPPTEADVSLECHDCGMPYHRMGLDLVLPDQQWKVIFPETHGVLCPNCICLRASKHGGTAILAWVNNINYP